MSKDKAPEGAEPKKGGKMKKLLMLGIGGTALISAGAGAGIYLGGGIIAHLGDFFLRSAFRQRFEDKGRFSAYLAHIPTFIIDAPYAALSGAAIALESPLCIGYESTERAQ